MVPVKLFSSRYNSVRAVKAPRNAGTVPVNLFLAKNKPLRAVMDSNEEGMVPVKSLPLKPKTNISVQADIIKEDGIDPIKSLRPSSKRVRTVKADKDGGIVPANKFWVRSTWVKLPDKRAKLAGM